MTFTPNFLSSNETIIWNIHVHKILENFVHPGVINTLRTMSFDISHNVMDNIVIFLPTKTLEVWYHIYFGSECSVLWFCLVVDYSENVKYIMKMHKMK
jgi:hypothetical protein